MRILIRIFAVLTVLAVLALVGLAVALPRLAKSDDVRSRILEAAREGTGRDFTYADLDVGLLPPRLVMTKARLAGATAKADPMLEGADVQLRLGLLPLLARAVVVDSLVVEGAILRLVRTKDGIQLPEPEAAADPSRAGGETVSPESGSEDGGVSLAVRRVVLRDVRVVLEDHAVSPAVTWDLTDVQATGVGRSLEDPLEVKLTAALATGGRFALEGDVTPGGSLDLSLDLDEVDLAPAASYLAKGQRALGRMSGRLVVRGEQADDPAVKLDLRLADADVAVDELRLTGGIRIEADLAGIAAPTGSFSLDATAAKLVYGTAFQKPAGTQATVEGRVVPGQDGAVVLEDTRMRVKNLDAQVQVEAGTRTRLRIDAAPFDLAGWQELVPALTETPVKGRLGFEALNVATEPLDVKGTLRLEDLRLPQSKDGELVLRGALVGEGSAIRGDDLVASFAGQELALDLKLTNLARQPKLELRTGLEKADSNELLTVLAGKPDTLSGPLTASADLALPLGGDADPSQAISGTVRFEIAPGRLKGVSILRSAFERFGAFGEAAILAGQVKGGRTLQRFYDDEFQSLSGSFRLGGGSARSDDLRLVYRHYSVDLRGNLGLADQALDFTGTLTMDEAIDTALQEAPAEGGTPAAIPDGGATQGRSRTLPLAQVVGTLDAPKVKLTREAVIAFSTRTGSLGRKRDDIQTKIDEKLGAGSGEKVLDVLEGILGGRKR